MKPKLKLNPMSSLTIGMRALFEFRNGLLYIVEPTDWDGWIERGLFLRQVQNCFCSMQDDNVLSNNVQVQNIGVLQMTVSRDLLLKKREAYQDPCTICGRFPPKACW